jgi:hypothetical protein
MADPLHYWTQSATDPSTLDELVNARIDEGWEVYGSAYAATPADPDKDPLFCQPMMRRSKDAAAAATSAPH